MGWRVELFGGPTLISPEGKRTTRFATQKTAGVLAYLALTLPRSHPREVLAELFWPEKDPTLSRNSLSAVLSDLRPLLGSALVTDKLRVGLDEAQVTTDVVEFESALARCDIARAAQLSAQEFLPGLYDDWVVTQRERLLLQFETASEAAVKRTLGRQGRLHDFPLIENEFIGRARECEQVRGLLCQTGARLVTLKGMGGVGKTRLAHEVSQQCRAHFPGGVFWVALEEVGTREGLLRRVAAALRVVLQPGSPLEEQLGWALLPRGRVLLVLDNTEQIAEAALGVRGLLAQASECVCLVTSRLKLGLRAEKVLELEPLTLPEAEQLFRERVATALTRQFFPEESVVVVQELCRRLDGLPLALELAAARITTLTPEQMLARFNERFRILQSRSPDLPERHRTLWTTIDWSYRGLSEATQRLLDQLSVFVGPFSLEEAETVCAGGEVLEGILLLQESSLLNTERLETRFGRRFLLLESVRAYATERLAEQPALEARTHQRHAEHYLRLAQAQLARLSTSGEAEALRQLDGLAANVQAALEHASPELAPGLALALARPLQRRGFFTEAVPFLERVLATQRLPELVWERAGLHFDQGEYAPAHQLADEARVLYAAGGDPVGEARSENLLGQIAYKEQRWKVARCWLEQARERLEATTAALEQAIAKNNLALVEFEDPDGDHEKALTLLSEALVVHRNLGDLRGVAATVTNLGNLTFARGDGAATFEHFTESLEVELALGNVFGVARALNNLGETQEQQGKPESALRYYGAAHQLFLELKHAYAAYTEGLIQALTETYPRLQRAEVAGKDLEALVQEARV